MFLRSLALAALISAPALAAPVPKEAKAETNPLVGTWVLTESSLGGGAPIPRSDVTWKLGADGKASIIGPNAPPREGIKYAFDPKAKTFDWVPPWGEFYGVYELQDDTLTVFTKQTKDKAARNLETKIGPGINMHRYRRVAESK